MPTEEGTELAGQRRRAHRPNQPTPPINIAPPPAQPSPTVRLDAMTRERIDSLEADKRRLHERIEQLQAEVDRLAPENARLIEALRSVEANNIVATILIAVGGGIISYATFTGNVGPRVADVGGGALLAGAFLPFTATIRRRRAR
jgi:hypothetical protein